MLERKKHTPIKVITLKPSNEDVKPKSYIIQCPKCGYTISEVTYGATERFNNINAILDHCAEDIKRGADNPELLKEENK